MRVLTRATAITVLSACLGGLVLGAISLGYTKECETVDLGRNIVAPNVAIPPIDASAPTNTETATFALG